MVLTVWSIRLVLSLNSTSRVPIQNMFPYEYLATAWPLVVMLSPPLCFSVNLSIVLFSVLFCSLLVFLLLLALCWFPALVIVTCLHFPRQWMSTYICPNPFLILVVFVWNSVCHVCRVDSVFCWSCLVWFPGSVVYVPCSCHLSHMCPLPALGSFPPFSSLPLRDSLRKYHAWATFWRQQIVFSDMAVLVRKGDVCVCACLCVLRHQETFGIFQPSCWVISLVGNRTDVHRPFFHPS